MIIKINTSLGELLDKISILKVKLEKVSDKEKLININTEYQTLNEALDKINLLDVAKYLEMLYNINLSLWNIEDNIRKKEKAKAFDEEFILLARSVYKTNDKRFEIKNEINMKYGSDIKEEKEYEDYNEN